MPEIAEKYNLNHIYEVRIDNLEMAIGAANQIQEVLLEFFERSLALTSDLRRLPILRSISGTFSVGGALVNSMNASGITGLAWNIAVFNDDDNDDIENLIWEAIAYAHQNAGVGASFAIPPLSWDYEGGVLLNNEIDIVLTLAIQGLVAGANFPAGTVGARLFFEVDWAPVTKKEFSDFILENVYAIDR